MTSIRTLKTLVECVLFVIYTFKRTPHHIAQIHTEQDSIECYIYMYLYNVCACCLNSLPARVSYVLYIDRTRIE